MQFTKLFNSILDSTIWQEPPPTKLVWITMLAMADRNGEVHASIPGLAKRAGVTLSECEHALECLLSPDKYSRTQDHEGRRIKEIDGGFRLLNHGKYRALLSAEERREYNRQKQAEYRASQKRVNDMSMTVNHNKQCAHSTEAEAEADTEKNPPNPPRGEERAGRNSPKRPTLQEIQEYASTLRPPFTQAAKFHSYYESNGWKVGRNPMKDWKAAVRTWTQNEKPNHREIKASKEFSTIKHQIPILNED
jgi:hypothetical protein